MTFKTFVFDARVIFLCFGFMPSHAVLAQNHGDTIEEITVTAKRSTDVAHDLSISKIEDISEKQSTHIAEVINFAPNTWISKGGNAQENLTAIRSPSYTGGGSCSNFLISEDNIPLRAPAFCNVNQFFDANYQQAQRIEVLRGPGTAFHGSGAVHGTINIISPKKANNASNTISLMKSSHSLSSFGVDHREPDRILQSLFIKDDGYKNDTGYEQQKVRIKEFDELDNGTLTHNLNLMNLDQQTVGYTENGDCGNGDEAYKEDGCKKFNPTPDAYRKAKSLRLYSELRYQPNDDSELVFTPFLRANKMKFTMHYLPAAPIEENSHNSMGLQAAYIRKANDTMTVSTGFDFDYSAGELRQEQTEVGPIDKFPVGIHYDYKAKVTTVAMFSEFEKTFLPSLTGNLGVRLEHARYDYKNLLNEGSACLPSVAIDDCRYYRPASDKENYFNMSANTSLQFEYIDNNFTYLRASRGFRAPHSSDLYRLEEGQAEADIDSEKLDAIEWGFNGYFSDLVAYQLIAYYMEKDNVIVKTSDRDRLDGQKTKHKGAELALSYYPIDQIAIIGSTSYSKHQYDSSYIPFGGNDDINGNIIDTAPRHIHSMQVKWFASDSSTVNITTQHLGNYYLDAENQYSYEGHTLTNIFFNQLIGKHWSVDFAINNAFDIDYADRADFNSFSGEKRYFIGEPRSYRITISALF